MLEPKLNFKFTKGLPLYQFQENGEPLPSSFAMTWCMTATAIHRIFTKEDMKEFLFRMAITLHSMDPLENWLVKDRLMNYTVKGKEYVLNLNDIIMHFGFEIFDAYDNRSSREKYQKIVLGGMKGAMLYGALEGFSIIKPEVTEEEDGLVIRLSVAEDYTPEITPELISKAEFFASDLMKFIPEETFTNRNTAIIEKEKELEERQERIKHLPVFDIKKIPSDIIKQCFEIAFSEEYVQQLLTEPDEFEKEGRPIIYLAWMWANNFMETNGYDAWEKEGFYIHLEDYPLDGPGYNLHETIENNLIEDMVPLLKGLLI